MYTESTHEIQLQCFIVHTLNSGLSMKNAFYIRRPIGILYKSQRFCLFEEYKHMCFVHSSSKG